MMEQLLLPRDVIRRSSVLGTSTSGKWGITFTQIMGRNICISHMLQRSLVVAPSAAAFVKTFYTP
jgi:hypothetical protein